MVNKKTKIIRIILTVICLSLVLMFTLTFMYCSYLSSRKYTCDVDDVESVQIVKIYALNSENPDFYEYRVLAEVSDYEQFIERLCDIDQNGPVTPPDFIDVGCIVIKINYTNGDYDMVYHTVQIKHRDGRYLGGMDYSLDRDEFDQLINDYLEEG